MRKRDAPSYFKAAEALSGIRQRPSASTCCLRPFSRSSRSKVQKTGKTARKARLARDAALPRRLRSTSAELARFQSPLVLDDEALERPAPHLPAQVADPAHVHARERERASEPRADAPEGHERGNVSPIVQLDPLKNVGYIYDVPREDLDFLDGTPEPVQGSERERAKG